jgi:ectoine hydroxylase-related dioxygenase (phytanoyl-CoA dioxygenase family)
MIDAEEIRRFDEEGAVTIDTPLSRTELRAAGAAMERLLPFDKPPHYRVTSTNKFVDPALIDLIQHPFFEAVARQVLRAEKVHFRQVALACTYPQTDPFTFDQHVDIQYSLANLQAVPRQMICSYFIWLSDVNERRAPLMYRPGSHRLIAAHRQKDSTLKDVVPTVAGVKLEDLPPLPYADPVPLQARAGQATVLTTSLVHGASINVDTLPRQSMHLTFDAAQVEVRLPPNQAQIKEDYDRQLRPLLRPERVHIIPSSR